MNTTTTEVQLRVFWPTELQGAWRTALGRREVGGLFLNFTKITMVYLLYLEETGSVLPKTDENKTAKKSRLIDISDEVKYSHMFKESL